MTHFTSEFCIDIFMQNDTWPPRLRRVGDPAREFVPDVAAVWAYGRRVGSSACEFVPNVIELWFCVCHKTRARTRTHARTHTHTHNYMQRNIKWVDPYSLECSSMRRKEIVGTCRAVDIGVFWKEIVGPMVGRRAVDNGEVWKLWPRNLDAALPTGDPAALKFWDLACDWIFMYVCMWLCVCVCVCVSSIIYRLVLHI
jgi:hypothetical protein